MLLLLFILIFIKIQNKSESIKQNKWSSDDQCSILFRITEAVNGKALNSNSATEIEMEINTVTYHVRMCYKVGPGALLPIRGDKFQVPGGPPICRLAMQTANTTARDRNTGTNGPSERSRRTISARVSTHYFPYTTQKGMHEQNFQWINLTNWSLRKWSVSIRPSEMLNCCLTFAHPKEKVTSKKKMYFSLMHRHFLLLP